MHCCGKELAVLIGWCDRLTMHPLDTESCEDFRTKLWFHSSAATVRSKWTRSCCCNNYCQWLEYYIYVDSTPLYLIRMIRVCLDISIFIFESRYDQVRRPKFLHTTQTNSVYVSPTWSFYNQHHLLLQTTVQFLADLSITFAGKICFLRVYQVSTAFEAGLWQL